MREKINWSVLALHLLCASIRLVQAIVVTSERLLSPTSAIRTDSVLSRQRWHNARGEIGHKCVVKKHKVLKTLPCDHVCAGEMR